jgi:hypothetical protein
MLGRGTYGEVYTATRQSDGAEVVVKVTRGTNIRDVVKETIINILIVKETEGLSYPAIHLTGPFAPCIYDFGYDTAAGTGFIISEKMRATVNSALSNARLDKTYLSTFFKMALLQLSVILKDMGRLLRFNHRDFKSDNCMYVRDAAGNISIKLIDFGFSCITYNGMYIAGNGGYSFKHCNVPGRDLTQFIYEIYKYHPYMPAEIHEFIEALLTFPVGKRTFKMYSGRGRVKDWRNTYDFLNDKTVVNQNCLPENLYHIALAFFEKKPWRPLLQGALAVVPIPVAAPAVAVAPCPPGKIWNPNTRRCVLATGAVGKALQAVAEAAAPAVGPAAIGIKACPPTKPDYNPATRRCVKACPAGKKRNAATFKCKGTAKRAPAKRAVVKRAPAKRAPAKRAVAARARAVAAPVVPGVKTCPPAKPDYNPATRRCVKACPAGKRRNAATFKCVK